MLIIGLELNLRILLLKLSHILFTIVSVKASLLNMCLAILLLNEHPTNCVHQHQCLSAHPSPYQTLLYKLSWLPSKTDQNTRMVLPEVVVEVPVANPMFILWPVINESLHQPLSQTVSKENMS